MIDARKYLKTLLNILSPQSGDTLRQYQLFFADVGVGLKMLWRSLGFAGMVK
jgi:hypothetical protein